MILSLNAEQEMLADQARRMGAEYGESSRRRRAFAEPDRIDHACWSAIAGLGWTAIGIDADHEGTDLGQVELAVVMMEAGRSLLPVPLLASTGFATPLIRIAGSAEQRRRWLPRLADGSLVATVASSDPDSIPCSISGEGEALTLSGTVELVLNGDSAGLILVPAHDQGGISLVALERDRPGMTIEPREPLDPTRAVARIRFDRASVSSDDLLGKRGDGETAWAEANELASIALAAESLGGAEACLDMAVEYAKQRKQFGRPIGSFQAIKHKLADLLALVESARSAVFYAAAVADQRPAERAQWAAIAKSSATEAYWRCAADNVQVHGGIGFTAEHDAHLYLKRARTALQLLGSPQAHRRRLAAAIGLEAA